jgi:hypothetical protein
MAKAHPGAEIGQPGLDSRCSRVRTDAHPHSCQPEQRWIAERLGGSDQEQAPGLIGEGLDLTTEALLHRRRDLCRPGQNEPTG